MVNWDPATGNVIVPQGAMDKISPLYPSNINIVAGDVVPKPDNKNFVPRIGFAYRLSDKTVLRGGYGIFNEFLGQFSRVNGGGPFEIAEYYTNSITNGVPFFQMPNPFPSTPGVGGHPVAERYRLPDADEERPDPPVQPEPGTAIQGYRAPALLHRLPEPQHELRHRDQQSRNRA